MPPEGPRPAQKRIGIARDPGQAPDDFDTADIALARDLGPAREARPPLP